MPPAKKSQKKRMTQKELRAFTASKFENVRMLLEAGKLLEAMVYLFNILSWLIEDKMDVKRPASATIKEYFADLLKNSKLSPENVHPFVNLMEETLYSHHTTPDGVIDSYKERWANLYKEISGDVPPAL
jgi:hypothetical protein